MIDGNNDNTRTRGLKYQANDDDRSPVSTQVNLT